jgi:hypothetical protein
MWPGSSLHGMYVWQNPRWEDYDYTLKDEQEGNPFSWLGNGYVGAQLLGDVKKTTFYLDEGVSDVPVENPLVAKKKHQPPLLSAGPVNGIAGAA